MKCFQNFLQVYGTLTPHFIEDKLHLSSFKVALVCFLLNVDVYLNIVRALQLNHAPKMNKNDVFILGFKLI